MRVEQKTNVKNGIGRLLFVLLSFILQIWWAMFLILRLNEYSVWISGTTTAFSFVLVLYLYGRHTNSAMKMPWIMLILVFPILGTTLYLLVGLDKTTSGMRKRFQAIDKILLPKLVQKSKPVQKLKKQDAAVANIAGYLQNSCHYPLYDQTEVTYYKEAKLALEAQKEAMRHAKRFIFMEYHAIEDAEAFEGILSILEERAAHGVEVRIFYDDVGSIGFITTDFIHRMQKKNIQCRVFNRIIPLLDFFMNNRDHRKITVVDGQIGFTGGYNIANEYFNVTHPYGYWKDTGIRLEGEAVNTLTVLFLEMWNAIHRTDFDNEKWDRYFLGNEKKKEETAGEDDGFIQPYADSPLDEEQTGENVYMSIANAAESYVYYMTPYLILTDEMTRTLALAAKRGVDVRIIVPGIPDKKAIYQMTRSYYAALVRDGVRIFEYTPGFCHAKMCISDDKVATVGTINLDFRSLYHHFENGCVLYHSKAILDMKRDFDDSIQKSFEVTDLYYKKRSKTLRIGQCILRLFAPLL